MKPTTKRFVIVLGILFVVFGAIFGWDIMRSIFMKKYFANFTPPPETISAAPAVERTWQPSLTSVGTLTAVHGVNITSEVPGIIQQVVFQSGQIVEKGTLLIQLDAATDRADLINYEAQFKLDQADFNRKKLLFKEHAVSKVDVDQAAALLNQAAAIVEKAKNLIEKKSIRAPFAGRIGISSLNVGQYVAPGQALVTLQSIDPLYVQFSLPEQNLSQIFVGQEVQISSDNQPGKTFIGRISALDAKVDETTRSILLQATVPNKDHALFPGTFAEIKVLLAAHPKVITVPQTAVTFTLYGDSVFVLEPEKIRDAAKNKKDELPVYIAHQKQVITGDREEDWVMIKRGVAPQQLVVTAGQLKLQEGSRVVINNSVKLE